MKRFAILTVISSLLLLASTSVFAQGTTREGTVEIIRDPAIDRLVEQHIRFNQSREGIQGYRVQIFFDSGTNSKTRGQSAYELFSARYPDVAAYLTFKAPNYKVRVGDFRTRLDAVRFQQMILQDYPGAYVISDLIRLPKTD